MSKYVVVYKRSDIIYADSIHDCEKKAAKEAKSGETVDSIYLDELEY
jgi:hypothetical protein